MKNMTKTGLAMLAISISGCSTPSARATTEEPQIIEFKSGPEGFDTRTFFYVGANEVIAFDSQFTPDLTKKSIEHLRQYTKKPITWLVITHPNPDKFNGASVFKKEGARIVASKNTAAAIPGVHSYKEYFFVEMAKMFKKGTYPQPTSVDETFEGKMDIVLRGGERLELHELGAPGVSSTQTVAYVKSVNSLFVGDLVHHKAHAWLEGGIVDGKPTPTIGGWIQDLKELTSRYTADTIVYGGRGKTVDLGTAALEQTKYLKEARRMIRDEVKKTGKEPNYGELAKTFAAKFPDYALPYMIEYGAYGLAQDELAKLKQ